MRPQLNSGTLARQDFAKARCLDHFLVRAGVRGRTRHTDDAAWTGRDREMLAVAVRLAVGASGGVCVSNRARERLGLSGLRSPRHLTPSSKESPLFPWVARSHWHPGAKAAAGDLGSSFAGARCAARRARRSPTRDQCRRSRLPRGLEASGLVSPAGQQAVAADGRASLLPAVSCLSPVVKYHGLGLRNRSVPAFLMRPQLNSGTLGGQSHDRNS
jgi:hypothetical protein